MSVTAFDKRRHQENRKVLEASYKKFGNIYNAEKTKWFSEIVVNEISMEHMVYYGRKIVLVLEEYICEIISN